MADIQLSSQLFEDIQQAVLRQQPDADQSLILQYLAAGNGIHARQSAGMAAADRECPDG